MQYLEPDPELLELPLAGGDVTECVVRKGSTVRRQMAQHSPMVHAVLQHLESVGFNGSPRFLGIDAQGREVLSFVEGEVACKPWPKWVADEERAASVARLVRKLDDAMLTLGLRNDFSRNFEDAPGEPSAIGPAPTFLGHRDITPENVIFRDEQAFALIDFDLVKPSNRIDEVCNMLLWWAPLMPECDREPVTRDVDAIARVSRLITEYGLDAESRELIVPVAQRTAERAWRAMRFAAERHGGGWRRMWENGYGERNLRRQAWLKDNAEALHRAAFLNDT